MTQDNLSRRRFVTSVLATASLGTLAGCSGILTRDEKDASENSSTTPTATSKVTKTVTSTIEAATTSKTTSSESTMSSSSDANSEESSSQKTQQQESPSQKTDQQETTSGEASPTPNSRETSQAKSARPSTTISVEKVRVNPPETTADEKVSTEQGLNWFLKALQAEGVTVSNARIHGNVAKIDHTTKQKRLVGKLAGEIGTVAGHWAQFITKVRSPPAELQVTLKDESGDTIGGYSVMTKDAQAVMNGSMTTDEFSYRIVSTIRFSPEMPTTTTTRARTTTRTTTTSRPTTTTRRTPPKTTATTRAPPETTTSTRTTNDSQTTKTSTESTTTTTDDTTSTTTVYDS